MAKTNILVLTKTSSEDEDEDERRLQNVFIKTNICWDVSNTVSIHAFLVPKTKISDRKKEGNNQFLDWQVCLAQLISSTDSRLNMLISVMLKKACSYMQLQFSSYIKERTRSHIFLRKHLSLQRIQVLCEQIKLLTSFKSRRHH